MMNTVKLHDKEFGVFISRDEIAKAVEKVAAQINHDYANKTPLFVAVLNGSFIFASDLMKQIHIDSEITFVKLASYSGTSTTGKVSELIGFNESIEGRDVIILEDIVDTGITLEILVTLLQEKKANSVAIATCLFKPKAYTKSHAIEYVGLEVGNEFLVGYGLDYNGRGRNLADIYKIIE